MSNTSDIFFSMYEIDGKIKIDNFKSNLSIFITPWSLAHFISGYMTQAFGINYFYGFVLHTIYEYGSYKYKKKWNKIWKGFKSDSMVNTIGDTFVFMLAMVLAKNYNNAYLFIFIFLIGLLFFSRYFQDFLLNQRLKHLKSKDNKLTIHNTKFDSYSYYFDYIWIISSLIVIIKLYVKGKKNKTIFSY